MWFSVFSEISVIPMVIRVDSLGTFPRKISPKICDYWKSSIALRTITMHLKREILTLLKEFMVYR